MKKRKCDECKEKYMPAVHNQKYCKACNPEKNGKRQIMKIYPFDVNDISWS